MDYATNPRAAFGSYENYLTFPTFLNDENGAVEIIICGNGLGYFKCQHEVAEGDCWTTSIPSLIDAADIEIERLKNILHQSDFKQYLDNHHLPGELQISDVYSHNFIIKKNIKEVARNLGNENPQVEKLDNIKAFYCNSTANIFQFEGEDFDYFINLCANITVFTATLYIIQEIALKESMKLIKDKFIIKDEASITETFHTRVSYFNQHLVNMKSMNFVDNILVENTIGRIARAWDWHGVLISSERAVAHFASQINKAENENKRKSDRRVNTILLGFTLISIISTVAVVIQLYDFKNNIDPEYRIITVIISFFCSILLALLYLRRKK